MPSLLPADAEAEAAEALAAARAAFGPDSVLDDGADAPEPRIPGIEVSYLELGEVELARLGWW